MISKTSIGCLFTVLLLFILVFIGGYIIVKMPYYINYHEEEPIKVRVKLSCLDGRLTQCVCVRRRPWPLWLSGLLIPSGSGISSREYVIIGEGCFNCQEDDRMHIFLNEQVLPQMIEITFETPGGNLSLCRELTVEPIEPMELPIFYSEDRPSCYSYTFGLKGMPKEVYLRQFISIEEDDIANAGRTIKLPEIRQE